MTSRRCQMTSRRRCTTSRRSGSVLGGFLAHFEPIMEGFEAQTRKRRREAARARRRGLCPHFGDQGGGWELFLKIWEKIMRFVEENPRLTII